MMISVSAGADHVGCDAKQMLPVFLVCLGVLGCKPVPAQNPAPDAELVWSVTLENNASLGNTSSDFAASRRAVIAGDRVVVILDVGPLVFENGRPKSTYRLLSLDLNSGVVRNQQDITDYRMPDLYATDDDHVIMGEFSLTRLNSDLTSTTEVFTEKGHGRTIQISPDGSILAHETTPGTELLDSHNFLPTGIRFAESVPTAVSTDAVLTDNVHWVGQYPHDASFVTLTDKRGQHLLYHGRCSGRPAFLTHTKVLVTGCGKLTILDTSGQILKEASLQKGGDFAGASRDGMRFAIQASDSSWGDPPRLRSETFTIYDTNTAVPLAIVRSKVLPERRSWAALSRDGRLFVTGSPARLTLFRIP
jgi:hypothetical protein